MLIHLPIVILASLPLTPIADNVPKFDIARECRSEGGSKAVWNEINQPQVSSQLSLAF
jgi:hypothetical protein